MKNVIFFVAGIFPTLSFFVGYKFGYLFMRSGLGGLDLSHDYNFIYALSMIFNRGIVCPWMGT